MDYDKIKLATLVVYIQCNVKSFPIDCESLLFSFNFKLKKYSEQSLKKKDKCLIYSKDAFTLKNTIYYNDEMPYNRIRFSLMHELAHKILEHSEPRTKQHEIEADYFASHILAPRMAIHYSNCKNLNDVSKLFGLSFTAAEIAYSNYRNWHRWTVYHKMNLYDKLIYKHFYDSEYNGFVYKKNICTCSKPIFNSSSSQCNSCLSVRESLTYHYSTYSGIGLYG